MLEQHLSRFFWADPSVILAADPAPERYRAAMSALHVGSTVKITGTDRHPAADALVAEQLDLTDAVIVDIGASDGSTSVELIGRLGRFRSYTIADLYLYLDAVRAGSHVLFYEPGGPLILVSGRRVVAWPSLSRPVRLAYRPLTAWAEHRGRRREVLLLNPSVQDLIARDGRVSYRVHDVFTPWPGERPDLIKVANLLRRLYFSDAQIRLALRALLESLGEGGHLLMVDNPRIPGIAERAGLYRRTDGRFVRVVTTRERPEIDELIVGTSVPA